MFGLTFPSPKKTFFLTRQAAGSLVEKRFLGEGKVRNETFSLQENVQLEDVAIVGKKAATLWGL